MTWTMEWLKHQLDLYLNEEQPRFEAYSEFLKSILSRARDEHAPVAIVEGRAKAAASFAEKCIRKHAKYPQPVYELTDLCGARIILETKDEVDQICDYIRTHLTIDEANSEDVRQRLTTSEFGYRSVHFVVQVPNDITGVLQLSDDEQSWLDQLNGGDPPRLRKAEIQVRTRLQHIWADSFHDRMYKTKYRIPVEYRREASRLAALMETADGGFGELMGKIDAFEVDFGAYLSPAEIELEITTLSAILNSKQLASNRPSLALRIAKVAKAVGDWDRIIETTKDYVDDDGRDRDKLRVEYGYALCKRNEAKPSSKAFGQGRKRLEQVASPATLQTHLEAGKVKHDETRSLALALLAWSHKKTRNGDFLRKARDLYYQAYVLNPHNPYHFKEFLECEVQDKRGTEFMEMLRPQINAHIAKCLEHAQVGIELPYAFFTAAKLYLLTQQTHAAMLAYIRGISASSSAYAIQEELKSVADLLEYVRDKLPALEHVRKLLTLGILTRCFKQARAAAGDSRDLPAALARTIVDKEPEDDDKVDNPSIVKRNPMTLTSPVVIVAGGADPNLEEQLRPYQNLLQRALQGFNGTIFSGGTQSGIPGFLGQIAADQDARKAQLFTLLAYLPRRLPRDASADKRYTRHYETSGEQFSYLEPLQNWIDILGAGIDPSEVRVLGIDGGKIAEFEYYLGLSMGAIVGLVSESGRKAGELLAEAPWWEPGQLLKLPADAMSINAFLYSGISDWERPELEPAAKLVHNNYIAKTKPKEESLRTWEELNDDHKRSCYHQVLFAANTLRAAGLATRPKNQEDIQPIDLEALLGTEGLRELGEREHGRWNVERLMQCWRYHEKKDVDKKLTPYIVPWDDLTDEIKSYDIDAIKGLPEVLREAGLEVYKPSSPSSL